MKSIWIQFLPLIMIGNSFLVMAQEDIKINSRIDGKRLNVTYQKSNVSSLNEAVLFIHGASFPSALASGFHMDGISWADNLSKAGYDVFSMDFLGYGKSDRYDYMSDNGNEYSNNSGGKDIANDIDIVVNYIRENFRINKIHLIGHSWGATVSGYYATEHPEKIDRLILLK